MTAQVTLGEQNSWAETPPMNPPIRYAIARVVESQTWLDKLGGPLQNWLLQLYGQPEQPNRRIKDIVNVSPARMFPGRPRAIMLRCAPIVAYQDQFGRLCGQTSLIRVDSYVFVAKWF